MSNKLPILGGFKLAANDYSVFDVIQATFYMVAFSTSLGLMGSKESIIKFGIDSNLAEFIVMVIVIFTYTLNHHITAYCSRLSTEKYNYAEFIEDNFGKKIAMTYDILMTTHNLILLGFIQQHITRYIFDGILRADLSYSITYYTLTIINIPLVFISITGDFKNIKWFCIVIVVAWVYIFIGSVVETVHSTTFKDYFSALKIFSGTGLGSWILKLIGFQLYFASGFQSLPFIYNEVKQETTMKHVINCSAVITLLIYFSLYAFSTFKCDSDPYVTFRSCGLVLIGCCAVVVNIVPARFALAQFLAGNDAETMKKTSGSDRVLSSLLILGSVIVSLCMVNSDVWNCVIGLAIILSSFLGVAVPPLIFLVTDKAQRIIDGDLNGRLYFYGYLLWCLTIASLGITAGLLVIVEPKQNYN